MSSRRKKIYKMSEEEKTKNLYYNSKMGFLSLHKLWRRIKDEGINISYNDLKKILEQQLPYELTKQVKKPKVFSNIVAGHPLQSTQLDVMIYDRYQYHNYKYVIGVIDVYSRYVDCRAITNMRMTTIMTSLKEIFKEPGGYPENINCDNQFNVPEFTNFFTKQGTKLWFSQPEQPWKNSLIERLWRTLALLLSRMRHGIKSFDWTKTLPDAIENYNSTWHRSIKATPLEVLEGKKENPIERKVVESVLKKGDRVRVKTKKSIFEKGDIQQFSNDIYLIVEKKGRTMNRLRNLNTGEELKRWYKEIELEQTFSTPENPKRLELVKKEIEKPKLDLEKTIAKTRPKRLIKKPVRLDL